MSDDSIFQPGVKKGLQAASKAFWEHLERRMPQVVKDVDKPYVAESLLLAIAAYRVSQSEGKR